MPETWRAREEALKVFNAVQVLMADLEAGPLVQSSLIVTSLEPEAVKSKLSPEKDKLEIVSALNPPVLNSSTSIADHPPLIVASEPQINLPVEACQLSVSAVPLQPSVPVVGKAEPKNFEAEA